MAAMRFSTPLQICLYIIVSGAAALVNVAVGAVLYSTLGLANGPFYAVSVAIAYLAGMAFNFGLNRSLTFRHSTRNGLLQMRTFIVVAGIGLLLTIALAAMLRVTAAPKLAALIASIGLQVPVDGVAHATAVALVSVYSFLGHKWLTFTGGIRAGLRGCLERRAYGDPGSRTAEQEAHE
jgi:putative flippase GtrA